MLNNANGTMDKSRTSKPHDRPTMGPKAKWGTAQRGAFNTEKRETKNNIQSPNQCDGPQMRVSPVSRERTSQLRRYGLKVKKWAKKAHSALTEMTKENCGSP